MQNTNIVEVGKSLVYFVSYLVEFFLICHCGNEIRFKASISILIVFHYAVEHEFKLIF